MPDGLPPIDGDPKRLHQVLTSVVANAIQFTPEKGTVDIRAVADGDAIELTVRDSGAGIPAEFLPHVFDRFRQADSRATRRHGGLGLGLAIARHVLEQHRGDIRADSDGPGPGHDDHDAPAGAAAAARAGRRARRRRRTAAWRCVSTAPRSWSSTISATRASCWRRCSSSAAPRSCSAPTPRRRCRRCSSSSVQLLVADIAMPDVDGYDLIRQVRQIDARLPAVAVTAYAYPQDRLKALAAGFTAYCAKPIDATHFLRIVRNVMLSSELSAPTPIDRPPPVDALPPAQPRALSLLTARPPSRLERPRLAAAARVSPRPAARHSSASVHRTALPTSPRFEPLRGWHRTCND